MTLIYILIGFYLGLFVHQKGWLSFEQAASPLVKLAEWIQHKIGGGPRYYSPGNHSRPGSPSGKPHNHS
jgi:hypothetical protein